MFLGTTVLAVHRDGKTAIAGDGQVTMAEKMIVKNKARKVRVLGQGRVIAGFAGSVADGLTLFEKFEGKLEQYQGHLLRAAVELAKEWRMDKMLHRLDALLLIADNKQILLVSGSGEVIEPDDEMAAIGSGGPYALAAARALVKHTSLPASQVAYEALSIASEICVYTNDQIIVEEL